MDKLIRYTSLSAVPSDYNANDGQLDFAVNAIFEDDAIRPLLPPQKKFQTTPDDTILLIHSVNDTPHFIIARKTTSGFDIIWCEAGGPPQGATSLPLIFSCRKINDTDSIGNTLVFSTEQGLVFAVWRDSNYQFLGAKPKLPAFRFALEKTNELSSCAIEIPVEPEVFRAATNYLPKSDHSSGAARPRPASGVSQNEIDSFFSQISNALYGHIFDSIERTVDTAGFRFYQPFFIRYAFRLFDGSHIWHSAPVLMLPTSIPPQIASAPGNLDDNGIYHFSANFSSIKLFKLIFSSLQSGDLEPWKDIITAIDFFVSAPLYTFDQSKSIRGYGLDNYNKTKALTTIPGKTRGRENLGLVTTVQATRRLDGIYRENSAQKSRWHFVNEFPHWLLPSRETELLDDIRSTSLFYRIASLKPDQLPSESDFSDLPVEDGVTPHTLLARPTLNDDFQSHHDMTPGIIHSYNNRLHIADISIKLAAPMPLRSLVCATTLDDDTAFTPEIAYRKDARLLEAARAASDADKLPDPAKFPPLFIYIHDADAAFLSLYYEPAGGTPLCFDFPLTSHDFLNGAYFFNGFDFPADGNSISPIDAAEIHAPSSPFIIKQSSIYVSEVNNPFIFPPQYAVSPGDARVMALSSAARPLSQGQFGQFPLYAFTQQGVWALELKNDGTYASRQPITRDTCLHSKAIAQLDSEVVFAAKRGIILLAGARTTCISDDIFNHCPLTPDRLPHLLNFTPVSPPGISFPEFIENCRFIYDYIHRRIIIFSPGISYAYVFSLKSNAWATMHISISYALNSYPQAMAVDSDNYVVDFASLIPSSVKALILTRPVNLDSPDTLKSVSCVIQRGKFRRGHLRSILYASRDLFTWLPVWSASDHFLRGFSGSPYKFFRIALLCDLAPDESIYGASIRFTPRMTNQPK